jgi:prepilin-type N-terminal cleavage/methylation domain-containing protein
MEMLPMRQPPRHDRGFTLVEMLTVLGIIGVLLALLLPALSGVTRGSHKVEELGRLRQMGFAWTTYARQHDDTILPGYLATATQQDWRVTYRYPGGDKIPPAPTYEPDFHDNPNIAGPWSWRLLPFIDFEPSVVLGHRETRDLDALDLEARAEEIANEPAFAYNGFHLGGWWGSGQSMALRGLWTVQDDGPEPRRVSVVSRTTSSVRRATKMIAFTSAAPREPGVYSYNAVRDDEDGTYIALAPTFMDNDLWGEARVVEPSPSIIERYGGFDRQGHPVFPDG